MFFFQLVHISHLNNCLYSFYKVGAIISVLKLAPADHAIHPQLIPVPSIWSKLLATLYHYINVKKYFCGQLFTQIHINDIWKIQILTLKIIKIEYLHIMNATRVLSRSKQKITQLFLSFFLCILKLYIFKLHFVIDRDLAMNLKQNQKEHQKCLNVF